jgi:hypothetical protein
MGQPGGQRQQPGQGLTVARQLTGQSSYHKQDAANYDNAPHVSTFKGNNVRIVLRGQLKRLQNQFALSIGHRTGNLR